MAAPAPPARTARARGLALAGLLALMLPMGCAGWPPGAGDPAEAAVAGASAAPGGDPAPAPEPEPQPDPEPAPEPGPAPGPEPQPDTAAGPPPPEPPLLAERRRACVREGGRMVPRAGGVLACVRMTGDGGRACTASRQCEGECLARSGTCAPVTPLHGCHEVWLAPGSRVTQCLD